MSGYPTAAVSNAPAHSGTVITPERTPSGELHPEELVELSFAERHDAVGVGVGDRTRCPLGVGQRVEQRAIADAQLTAAGIGRGRAAASVRDVAVTPTGQRAEKPGFA